MAELNLISVSEGPDLRVDEPVADQEFESLLADEVVVEWLQSLDRADRAVRAE
ncbi:hypothetical protein IC757_16245 [Wenzhouxiangella sp. AB-CW3]|uniref:hypothetical protein n=1 Tax=Wenzhouxiangella sp. AB-CW3 TaxID=2771012 RepID=UPI00168B0A15|nr:hypothetical protein [Wenzhouxiangella sp. AB-CW3]QOC22532.1 hypothetical protein IC757_16245 [Wenzhouxiangella sp. AB-CW3]